MKRFGMKNGITVLLFFAFFIFGCSGGGGVESHIIESEGYVNEDAQADPPNVILIVVDTLRYDHLSSSGYMRDTSPNIDGFKSQSTGFSNAITSASWTLPSYTSILLGKHAFNHNMNLPTATGPINGTILPVLMNNAGYRTVAIQTNFFLDVIDYDFNERYHYFEQDTVKDVSAVEKAVEWLSNEDNTKQKFFLFVGLISPHWPYRADTGYLEEFVQDELYNNSTSYIDEDMNRTGAITFGDLSAKLKGVLGEPQDGLYYKDARLYVAAYDGEIKFADKHVGILLDALKEKGLFDNSIIVITADHGEHMTDHTPHFSHTESLYNALLHVPLFIKFPHQYEEKDVNEYVRTIDILPTVFDYVGLDAGAVDGRTLLQLINGTSVDADERPVVSYHESATTGKIKVSTIKDWYKLIVNNAVDELYSLRDDRHETHNIAASNPELVEGFKDYIYAFYSGGSNDVDVAYSIFFEEESAGLDEYFPLPVEEFDEYLSRAIMYDGPSYNSLPDSQ